VRARPFRALLAGIRLAPQESDITEALDREQRLIGSVLSGLASISENSCVRAMTLERIQEESVKDPVLKDLVRLIRMGCPESS